MRHFGDTLTSSAKSHGSYHPRFEEPYSLVLAWLDTSPRIRPARCDQEVAAYKRIAMLPHAWGSNLDRLGVNYRELRWLAGAAQPRFADEREARYVALVTLLRTSFPTRREHAQAFAALVETRPKLRVAKKAAT